MKTLIILLLFCVTFNVMIWAQTATQPDGVGTSGDPYQIAIWENLYWLSQDSNRWDKHYVQTADISFPTSGEHDIQTWDEGKGWTSLFIEDEDEFGDPIFFKFTGSYNGQGYKVNNLFIDRPDEVNVGFLGFIEGATIQNVILSVISVEGKDNVGGLAGQSNISSIINCSVEVASDGITADRFAGGFVGRAVNTDIENCFVSGSGQIKSRIVAGGFVGYSQSGSEIINSYSTCKVIRDSGTNTAFGGFAGYNQNSEISYCYSRGDVEYQGDTNPTDKGFLGGQAGSNTYTSNFFITGVGASNQTTDAIDSATPLTTTEAKDVANYTDHNEGFVAEGEEWDFAVVWAIDETETNPCFDGYPFLQVFCEPYPAINPYPADDAVGVEIGLTFSWDNNALGNEPDGYTLKYWKTGQAPVTVDVTNGTEHSVSPDLDPNAEYNWQIIPYVVRGTVNVEAKDCPVWKFKTNVLLEIEINGNGQVKLNGSEPVGPGSYFYSAGTSVQIEAVPGSHWAFQKYVIGAAQYTNSTINITMNENKTLEVFFTQLPPEKAIDPTPDDEADDVEVELTFAWDWDSDGPEPDGYEFRYWRTALATPAFVDVDDVTEFDIIAAGKDPLHYGTEYSWQVRPYITLDSRSKLYGEYDTWTFTTIYSYTLNITREGQGSVEIDSEPISLPYNEDYEDGSQLTLKAIPASGWVFDKWVINAITYNVDEQLVTMDDNITAVAHFIQRPGIASAVNPEDEETDVPVDVTFEWDWDRDGPEPDGYLFNYWKQGAAQPALEDLGDQLTYSPAEDLDYFTEYEWQVIPYITLNGGLRSLPPVRTAVMRSAGTVYRQEAISNTRSARSQGSARSGNLEAENCPVWSFKTSRPVVHPEGTEISGVTVEHDGVGPVYYDSSPDLPVELPTEEIETIFAFSVFGTGQVTFTVTTSAPRGYYYQNDVWSDLIENDGGTIEYVIDFGRDNRGRSNEVILYGGREDEDPLPVELSFFLGEATIDLAVELKWRAETETNMLGYNVYRSLANSLSDASKINPEMIQAHNTSETIDYSYTDAEVAAGEIYYYWLQCIDLDLTYGFHGPIAVTVIYGGSDVFPEAFKTELIGAYPNPFNPAATIRFSLLEDADVTIRVYNARGQHMQTIIENRNYPKGYHNVIWNGQDSHGRDAASGVYFYKMVTSKGYESFKKMLLMKQFILCITTI